MIQKSYLSKSICSHLDIAIGDPFGGPAYGKKELPFIIGPSVAAAGTAIAAAAATTTVATVTAAAVATISAVASIATVAGLAMTIVGAATGDKELMQIGGIVGLAGGVTGWATSAISGAAGVAQAAASDIAAASTAAQPAAGGALAAASPGAMGGLGSVGVDAITPTFSSTVGQGLSTAATTAPTTATGGFLSGGSQVLGQTGQAALQGTIQTGAEQVASLAGNATSGAANVANAAGNVTNVANQSKSFFDSLTLPDTMKGVLEVGKVGAGMMQGSYQEDMANKTMQLKQDELNIYKDKFQFEKDQYNTQTANQNARVSNGLLVRKPTQAEKDQAALSKAKTAKQQAQILTNPAGA